MVKPLACRQSESVRPATDEAERICVESGVDDPEASTGLGASRWGDTIPPWRWRMRSFSREFDCRCQLRSRRGRRRAYGSESCL